MSIDTDPGISRRRSLVATGVATSISLLAPRHLL